MILIAGLGNPQEKYTKTRHNIGFMSIDSLAASLGADLKEDNKKEALIAEHNMPFKNRQGKIKIILVKPLTYMNKSGEAIQKVARYYRIDTKNIWIIHDDLDIRLGLVRVRFNGSSAGQRGVQSIIENLGTPDFYRIRFGIRPDEFGAPDTEDFVLQKFNKKETAIVKKKTEELTDAIKAACEHGLENTTF